MKKIWQLLGKPAPVKGDVGIEIEAEGEKLQMAETHYWKTVMDGSLRGAFPHQSAEYVLVSPVRVGEVKKALDELAGIQKDATLNFSFRTSVHVHINIQDITHLQLVNMVYTYLLIEEALVSYCGKERKGNRFCLRLQDAEGNLQFVHYLIKSHIKDMRLMNENSMRYSAINLAAIAKYGSLEFRSMRGTLDVPTLHNWVSALIQLKNYACSKDNPTAIFDEFCEAGPVEFLNRVLGVWAAPFIYPKMEKDLQRSFSLAIDVPFIYQKYAHRFVDEGVEEAPEKKLYADKINRENILADVGQFVVAINPVAEIVMPRKLNLRRPKPVNIEE